MTEPDLSGHYQLVRYHGLQLPALIGVIPSKGRNPGGCPFLITGGELELNIEGGSFRYSYDARNGCDQSLLSQPSLFGSVEQHGTRLIFRIHRVDGVIQFTGTAADGHVRIRPGGDEVLEYAR